MISEEVMSAPKSKLPNIDSTKIPGQFVFTKTTAYYMCLTEMV